VLKCDLMVKMYRFSAEFAWNNIYSGRLDVSFGT